jgi:hypothetical protein
VPDFASCFPSAITCPAVIAPAGAGSGRAPPVSAVWRAAVTRERPGFGSVWALLAVIALGHGSCKMLRSRISYRMSKGWASQMQGHNAPQKLRVAAPRSGARAAAGSRPAVSPSALIGIASLYASIGLAWFLGEAAPLREFAILVLISTGAAGALADRLRRAEWKSPFLSIGGPAAIFVFVCLLGFAFLHPESFGAIFGSLPRSGRTTRP